MDTYHIHIMGAVQGVGFRPFVHKLARAMHLYGYVSNTKDGVHIEVNADEHSAQLFYKKIVDNPPENALISHHAMFKIKYTRYQDFSIKMSQGNEAPNLFLTPDISLCSDCIRDITDNKNRRYRYPFTTCLQCGPRYSITKYLPYDRINTTMDYLKMCPECKQEYNDIENRRYYSQTNSCPKCAVHMHLYKSNAESLSLDQESIIPVVADALMNGKIVAVKGTGGYLLLCDASDQDALSALRIRKTRPAKPLAVMYPDIKMAESDVVINAAEKELLMSKSAPIVLCMKKEKCQSGIKDDEVAPYLDKIGVMLPNNPLLYLISQSCQRPLVTTSGNLSGSPILYKDQDALHHLKDIADMILTYDRDIVMPQDDSVIQISILGQKIILRRSRGMAPGYHPNPFRNSSGAVIAFGAELKSAFAIVHQNNLYISQYLGDQQSYDANQAYMNSISHFCTLFNIHPEVILADSHPGYNISMAAGSFTLKHHKSHLIKVQHHKAHFCAVMAEHGLLETHEPILGIIWDGSGYGDDGNIWGSEVLVYENKKINRVGHLTYFRHLMNDKMSREPRLSALSILHEFPEMHHLIKAQFNESEWNFYNKVLSSKKGVMTSSMGRFLDAIACMLGIGSHQSYEGEIVMKMEALARSYTADNETFYDFDLVGDAIGFDRMIQECVQDYRNSGNVAMVCRKVFYSLARLIGVLSDHHHVNRIAFSGGVFQNALLVDMIIQILNGNKKLYFHTQLSPNDECIGFGQLAYYELMLSTGTGGGQH